DDGEDVSSFPLIRFIDNCRNMRLVDFRCRAGSYDGIYGIRFNSRKCTVERGQIWASALSDDVVRFDSDDDAYADVELHGGNRILDTEFHLSGSFERYVHIAGTSGHSSRSNNCIILRNRFYGTPSQHSLRLNDGEGCVIEHNY